MISKVLLFIGSVNAIKIYFIEAKYFYFYYFYLLIYAMKFSHHKELH